MKADLEGIANVPYHAMGNDGLRESYSPSGEGRGFMSHLYENRVARGIAAVLMASSLAFLPGCSSKKSKKKKIPPTAALTVTPNPGMRQHSLLFDASGSKAGSKPITEYRFDFDGDGTWDYIETSASAPDGAFDGKTTSQCPNAADLAARVRVITPVGSRLAAAAYGVGFGDDSGSQQDAFAYSSGVLASMGYAPSSQQATQLLDPVTGQMVQFVLLKSTDGTKVAYVSFENGLTGQQKACLDNRASQGLNEPSLARLLEADSPKVIGDKLAAAVGVAKAEIAEASAAEAAPDCPEEDSPAETPAQIPSQAAEVF